MTLLKKNGERKQNKFKLYVTDINGKTCYSFRRPMMMYGVLLACNRSGVVLCFKVSSTVKFYFNNNQSPLLSFSRRINNKVTTDRTRNSNKVCVCVCARARV